jgi:hypothetical protein
MELRKLTKADVKFTLEIEQEDDSVRGNVCESEQDRKDEDSILERLEGGDLWAWCIVKVTATWEDGNLAPMSASAYLGHCSYADEEDFKKGGYYEDMEHDALLSLNNDIEASWKRISKLVA